MKDLPFHILLFLASGTVIVTISVMFSEADDGSALRVLPKRLLYFFAGCAAVAVVMLICEHTFASIH